MMGANYYVTVGLRSGRVAELDYPLSAQELAELHGAMTTGKSRTITIQWPDRDVTVVFDREAIETIESAPV